MRASCSWIDPEQLCRGAAEDGDAVFVAEAGDRHDVIERDAVPRERAHRCGKAVAAWGHGLDAKAAPELASISMPRLPTAGSGAHNNAQPRRRSTC